MPSTDIKDYYRRSWGLADGGRIGFYKAGFVEGKGWKVKFASKSTSPGYPDKFIGTQYYPSEEAANAAIEERKIFSQKNIELRDKKNVEMGKAKKAEYTKIIDDFIEKGDYENFKSQVYESQMAKETTPGKFRKTKGGRVPTHIVKFIRDRLDAGTYHRKNHVLIVCQNYYWHELEFIKSRSQIKLFED